jgi:phage terminase large subunit-like protein
MNAEPMEAPKASTARGIDVLAGAYFDEQAADDVCTFFELFLCHSKGEWAGRPFILAPWQRDLLRKLFGWKRANGTRLYRTFYLEVPRKNGKSTFCAGIALYLTLYDNEPGAEVFSAAADIDQAAIVFNEAKQMVKASRALSDDATVYKTSIFAPTTLSKYEVLSGKPNTKHGLNVHGVVIDELHALKDRELYDVLTTGSGSRRQPLTVIITTAGIYGESIGWEMHDYALKIVDGVIEDPEFLAAIYCAEQDDDPWAEETWKKANPNWGVSVNPEYLHTQAKGAKNSAGRENTFRRLHLNQWTSQAVRAISIPIWDRGRAPVPEDTLVGRKCWGALDLSATIDITAAVFVFEPLADWEPWDVVPFFWVPEDTVAERTKRDRVAYADWVKGGFMRVTPGPTIDHDTLREDIAELARRFRPREIAYDPWNAVDLCKKLEQDDGLPMIKHEQGIKHMTAPTKGLEIAYMAAKLRHGGHPVLRWMMSNLAFVYDNNGNPRPVKNKSTGKIDGAVALIMALARAQGGGGGLPYTADRGLTII